MPAEWYKVYRGSIRISGDVNIYKRMCINLCLLSRGLYSIGTMEAVAVCLVYGAPNFPFAGTAGLQPLLRRILPATGASGSYHKY